MPGFISHYICGELVLNQIQKGKSLLLDKRQLYNMGTQGPDIFFYSPTLFMRKDLRHMGTLMHNKKVGAFVSYMLGHIAILPAWERACAVSYLAGFLTHYCLDAKAHPYIYYKTGFRKKGDKIKAIRHSVRHRKFETAIDVLMLQLISSEKPSDKKLWQLIRLEKRQARMISSVISDSLANAYGLPVRSRHVSRALFYTAGFTRIMQSSKGKRKKIFAFVEDAVFGERLFSSLIHDQQAGGIDYLNSKKKIWCMPWDDKQTSADSFPEMFMEAVEQAVVLIEAMFAHFDGEMSRQAFLTLVGNNSLKTGQDAELALAFHYSDPVYIKRRR